MVNGQNSVNEYLNFLNKEHLSPKEYIFKLFEDNDIVILSERDHRDTTQYALIKEILADDRFINNIGHVYTEVGVVNRTEWANEILKNKYSDDSQFEKNLIKLYRELDYTDIWDKYNMYKYLRDIYSINKVLPEEKKISVGFTDIAFEWDGMTAEKYKEFNRDIVVKDISTRDSIMAANFINLYKNQKPINGNRKALIIQNQPHAFNIDVIYKTKKIKTFGSYVKDMYAAKTKIVLLNWYIWGSWYFNPSQKVELVDDGKWDAAFKLTKYNPVGFNLLNTPFGTTDFHDGYEKNLKYEIIADGYIFYKPFYEFVGAAGIPNVVDDVFADELLRRNIIMFGENSERGKKLLKSPEKSREIFKRMYNTLRTFNCLNRLEMTRMKKQMNNWL